MYLSWFGHVELMSGDRMAKKIYDGKVSGRRGRGILDLLTFEISNDSISKILEEGHVESVKRLMIVDEAKKVCKGRSVWRSFLPDYPDTT